MYTNADPDVPDAYPFSHNKIERSWVPAGTEHAYLEYPDQNLYTCTMSGNLKS
jgi:hypothetical protein